MTKEETVKIMAVLQAAYPLYYKDKGKEALKPVVELWHMQFKEYDYVLVAAAVNKWIANDIKGFPPVIGQLHEELRKIMYPENDMTEQEAWSLVAKAARNGISGAREEYNKLPEVVQQVLGGPQAIYDYAVMDVNQFNTVAASNFMRSYRARKESVRETLTLPSGVRNYIEQVASSKRLKIEGTSVKIGGLLE